MDVDYVEVWLEFGLTGVGTAYLLSRSASFVLRMLRR